MPSKGSYDPITSPARLGYKSPPKVVTGGPEAWGSMPAKGEGIPGKYGYDGMGPKSGKPRGRSPSPKV